MEERKDIDIGDFELLIKSQDRNSGTLSDAVFALHTPIIGTSKIRMKFFQGFNSFPNVLSTTNEIFYDSTVAGAGSISLTPGYYFTNSGTVTYAESQVDLTEFTNEVRYVLLRLLGGLADSITVSPATGIMTIEWGAGAGATNFVAGTTALWLGYDLTEPQATTYTANNQLNLGLPQMVGIECPDFANKGFVDTYPIPSNSFLDVVPIIVNFGETIYYEPFQPVELYTRNVGRPLASFRVRFIDPTTRQLLPMVDWALGIVFTATSLIRY